MKEMWETMKAYFGDGFVPGSSPLRFNLHFCDMQDPASTTDTIRYGVELPESAMPLFSVLGDTCAPSCTCYDAPGVIQHIDRYLARAPVRHADDYTITSGKGDVDINQVSLYIMRDTLSWWVHWGGSLTPNNYWKLIYVAFAAIPDDVQIHPRDFIDGTYRFLGHSWEDCRDGLLAEGVPPAQVKLAEMTLWRQMVTQYLEKVDPELRSLLVSKTSLMTAYRVMTGNTLGCSVLLLASEGVVADGLTDNALEMASIAQCLSMDMAKEAMGVLEGEKTETVAGNKFTSRQQLKRELRWLYARCMKYLEAQPNAHLLRRYASSGLHYVPMMDRYLERVRGNVRFPIREPVACLLEPFIKHELVAKVEKEDGEEHVEKILSETITVAP
nr:humulene synthase, terpene cyclase [Phaeosphaeriaceae sp. CF-150626]